MSYLVFARKYRPQIFEDVVAQEHVTRTLKNAVANDRIGSGYLFCGPRGTGKTTTARILAKALNCVNGPTATPCGECSSCKEITAGSSMDVLEIDAASNTGVDDVRQLRENIRYLPSGGKKRIYIIDEVHRLSGAAFDALLKTLEEPPDHVLFMFATTEPMKVPETILSRTQRFDFKRVSAQDLADNLQHIAQKEGMEIEPAALAVLARKADGSVRDSLSLLDQIAAYSGNKISEADVVEALGLVDRGVLMSFLASVAEHQPGQALELVRRVLDAGVDVADFVDELIEHLRILLVLAADDKSSGVLALGEQEIVEYREQAQLFSVGDVLRLIKITADLNVDLRSGMDERLLLEVAAVKMTHLESTVRFEDILSKLAELELAPGSSTDIFSSGQKKKDSRPVTLNRGAERQSRPSPPPPSPPPQRELNAAIIRSGWDGFVTRLRGIKPMLAANISRARVQSYLDGKVTAVMASQGDIDADLVKRPDYVQIINECISEHFGTSLTVTFDVEQSGGGAEMPGPGNQKPKLDAKELVAKSDRLKKLLDKVDGEIIGIRDLS